MKTGELLSAYGLENESVLHLVERPAGVPETLATEESSSTPSVLRPSRTEMLFHTMSVDPSQGPLSMAGQVTQSLMGAFTHLFSGQEIPATFTGSFVPTTGTTNPNPSPNPDNPAPAPAPTHASPTSTTTIRVTSRPGSRQLDPRHGDNDTIATHQLVRTGTIRVLSNLNSELERICTLSNGNGLFPPEPTPLIVPESMDENDANRVTLMRNFHGFEQAYSMMATACRELKESIDSGNSIPWDRLHNTLSILQELPLLMTVQRRLLSTIKARPDQSLELPALLDVPRFLDRPSSTELRDNSNETHGNGRGNDADIEPPE
jgi:hypothetical protein